MLVDRRESCHKRTYVESAIEVVATLSKEPEFLRKSPNLFARRITWQCSIDVADRFLANCTMQQFATSYVGFTILTIPSPYSIAVTDTNSLQPEHDEVSASVAWAEPFFSEEVDKKKSSLAGLLSKAAESVRSIFDEKSAREWAQGFVIPQSLIDSDVKCLQAAQLNFVTMIRRRHIQISKGRLNRDRISRLRHDNPEIRLLLDLADGMRVHLPTGFTPNGAMTPTPLRKTYQAVAPAVNRMLCDLVHQRLAFLIPYDLALEYVPNLHLAKAHWTKKKGKESGRPLGDLTFVDGSPLNSPETAQLASDFYGEIEHPTIEDICQMVNRFWTHTLDTNPLALWSELVLWKMDLRGAYTLLSYRPEDVGLLGMMLTDNVIYFQTAGIFGWGGTPAAFQVVTRAIKFELTAALKSFTVMYVDDIIGIGLRCDLPADLARARNICTDLLGPKAVADEKQEQGRRLDIIGYTIDLDIGRVMIAEKNFLTALNGFSTLNLTEKISIKSAQRIASWASRYGKICRVMRPFCGALNRLSTGRSQPYALFHFTPEARIAVRCWRAMLYLLNLREMEFTRTLASFSSAHPTAAAVFDSSLSGVGVIWYSIGGSAEVPLGVCAVGIAELQFTDDSQYQNLAEFIGALVAVAGHAMLGQQGESLLLRGDSITALTWALTERTRGSIVTKAAMIWAQLCVATDTHITEIQHISGTDNYLCDSLSRRNQADERSVTEHASSLGVIGARTLNIEDDADIMPLIRLCNPSPPLDSEEQFAEFWGQARTHINSFVARYPRAALQQH
jgi:hypothetical protein